MTISIRNGQATVTKPASRRRGSATSPTWGAVRAARSGKSEWRRIPVLVVWVVVVALMLGSCASLGRAHVDVEMDNGSWTVSPTVLGDVELAFRFVNTGSQAHQPVVILTSLPPDGLPIVDGRVNLANVHIVWPSEGEFSEWPPDDGTGDLFELVDPGQTVEDAPRALGEGNPGLGSYVVFCYLPGHYQQGEYGVFELSQVS